MQTKDRAGKFYLAPVGARDPYTAGYDGNVFETGAEALAAIPELRACGAEFDHEWTVEKY